MDERRDDWRHGVDESLVSLNTAQRVTDQQIDDLELNYEAFDKILRGDPENKEDGLIAEVHALDNKINDFRAELFRIKQVLSDDNHERHVDRRDQWGNWTKIIVAIITSGALGLFWKDILAFLNKKTNDPVEQAIERAEHPKPRHRHYVIHEDQETE